MDKKDPYIAKFRQQVKKIDKLDQKEIDKALKFCYEVHDGQKRKTGEKYFYHPLRVASMALKYELDSTTIVSCLLHDTIEDVKYVNQQTIEEKFGHDVANIVYSLTKVKKNKYDTMQKIFSMGKKDLRNLLVKLFDRVDNLQDLSALSSLRRKIIAQEALSIYSIVAQGLGFQEIEDNLKNLGFKNRYTKLHHYFDNLIQSEIEKNTEFYDDILFRITKAIPEKKISNIEIIYKKPYKFKLTEVHGLPDRFVSSIEIVTSNQIKCYEIIGYLHSYFRATPRSFRDYFSNPLSTGFRALTTEININGNIFSITITTKKFYQSNKLGVISLLKEGIFKVDHLQNFLDWFLELAQQNYLDLEEVLRIEDVYQRQAVSKIQVLDQKGNVRELDVGASVLDYAFMLNEKIGLRCSGALVNGKKTSLNKILQEGERIEILTDSKVIPSKDWLKNMHMFASRKILLSYFQKS